MVGTVNSENVQLHTHVTKQGVTGYMKDIMRDQTAAQVKETNLKEDREKNIIVYKIAEVEGAAFEDRKRNDKEFATKLLKELNREDIVIMGTVRLGRFDASMHSEGKNRPLKILLGSKDARDSVMRNRFKLGETNSNDLKNIKLGYDLSLTERAEVKDKIDEAKSKSNDQFFCRVRGPPWALRLQMVERRQPQTTQS